MENPVGNSDALWELALASTSQVSCVAARLAAIQKNPGRSALVLGELAARLCVVHKALDRPSPGQQHIVWRRLEKLLKHLERVCTWPNGGGYCPSNTHSSPYPTLDAIVSHSMDVRERAEKRVQIGLAMFASAHPKTVDSYYSNLQRFTASRREDVEELTDAYQRAVGRPKKPLEMPEEYPAHVNKSLYEALHLHSSCTCSDTDDLNCDSKQHWGRLRLKGRFQCLGDHIVFDTHFSAGPSTIAPNGDKLEEKKRRKKKVHWQQLRLHVLKQCGGKLENCPSESSKDMENSKIVQVGKFCDLLRTSVGDVRICLYVQAGQLRDNEEIDQVDQYILHQPSIPLAEALQLRRLSTRMKIALSYILAQSFWQFYNSDWMKSRWTSEFIHFMLEKSVDDVSDAEQPKIKACNPCYSFRFNDPDSDFTEYCVAPKIRHRYPRVLALGILLLEIGGEAPPPPQVDAGLSQNQSIILKINNDWATGKSVLKSRRWPDFDFKPNGVIAQTYKTVVANCFDENIFKIESDQGSEQRIEDRRVIFYERIVYPLNKLLRDMGWLENLEAIEPIELTQRDEHASRVQSVASLQSQSFVTRTALKHQETVVKNLPEKSYLFDDKTSGEGAEHADSWFELLRKDVFPLLPQNRKPGNRVKIAILDTGIDISEPFISTNRTRITFQSFLSDETSIEDIHGHGTHSAALLLRVAEHADIYVARVAKKDDFLDPKSIEQAIEAAINEGANIISMSFGFPAYEKHLEGIQRAICKAASTSILIFCAASNGGGNTNIAYPANQNEVICINSANGQGNPSGYNPGEAQEGRNLCALGEGVKSSWPNLPQQRKSGTSIATPIAAALAAVVLDYVWQNMPDSDEFLVSKLQMRKGMLEVLIRLMSWDRQNYYYLDPGKLFNRKGRNIYGSILDVLVNV